MVPSFEAAAALKLILTGAVKVDPLLGLIKLTVGGVVGGAPARTLWMATSSIHPLKLPKISLASPPPPQLASSLPEALAITAPSRRTTYPPWFSSIAR